MHGAELWRLKAGEELAALVTDFNTELTLVQPPLGQPAHTVGSEPRGLTASGDSVLFTAVITAGFTRTNKLYRATADSNTFVPLNDLGPDDVIQQILPVGAPRGRVRRLELRDDGGDQAHLRHGWNHGRLAVDGNAEPLVHQHHAGE